MFGQGGIRATPLNGAYYSGMNHRLSAIEESKAIERPTSWFGRVGACDASAWRDGLTYEGAIRECEVH
jgi:hypothetical protein